MSDYVNTHRFDSFDGISAHIMRNIDTESKARELSKQLQNDNVLHKVVYTEFSNLCIVHAPKGAVREQLTLG